jgi:outer membrane protein OmpA-like peptidoglycan-associated protein
MYRLWRQEGLQVPKKRPRRRVATGRPRPLLYTCAGTQCGEQDGWFGHFYLYPLGKHLSQTPAHSGSGGPAGQVSEYVLSSPVNQRYLAAKRSRPEGDVYVSVYVATSRWNYHKDTADHPIILLDVIDAVPIETGMVTIDAAAMAKDISSTGHVALYGIYFDTDKADLKPESRPTLQEIARLLKQDAALKLYVVGHTDNVGGFDYNSGLSERRAVAVVKELTANHGIAATRPRRRSDKEPTSRAGQAVARQAKRAHDPIESSSYGIGTSRTTQPGTGAIRPYGVPAPVAWLMAR